MGNPESMRIRKMRSKSNSKAAEVSDCQSKVTGIPKSFRDRELGQFSKSPKGKRESIVQTFQRWSEKPESMTMLEETLREKTRKKKERLNFLKRGKIEGTEQSAETGSAQTESDRFEYHPVLRNVHLSRPSTPQSVPCASMKERKQAPECDTFKVRCLLKRVEQQLQHTTNIIKKMQENGVQRARISLVGKVMREVLHLRYQLLRILDNDPVTLVQIGDADDLEEFFLNVEDICSAAEEIKFQKPQNEETLKAESAEKKKFGLFERLKFGKGKKSEKSQSQSSIEGQAENEDNTPTKTRNAKAEVDSHRSKTRDDAGQPTISKNEDNHLKLQNESGLWDDWSDPDTDDEMTPVQGQSPIDSQKYKWPMLNTTDKARIEKEKQLHTLMTEIDGLMDEVGLADKTKQTGITYEVLMGSCEKHVNNAIKDAKKVRMSKNPSKMEKSSKSQSDLFDEELDKLLAECDGST